MNLFMTLIGSNIPLVNHAMTGWYPALCLTLAIMVIFSIWQTKNQIPVKFQLIFGGLALVVVISTLVLYSQNIASIIVIAILLACLVKLVHFGFEHYIRNKR